MGDSSTNAFRHILVIHNPTAGGRRRRRLRSVVQALSASATIELHATTCRGDAEIAARDACAGPYDLVLVAGGDGTVNEVANGLAACERPLPMALLPMGTANVLAAEIGLSVHPRAVVAAIRGGRRRRVRLAQAGDRFFVLMASAGIDAAVVHGLDLGLKRGLGKLAYAIEAVRQALSYAFPSLTVVIDGRPHAARMAVACKARCYGGPFRVAPNADLGDGLLHVVLLEDGGLGAVLRYGFAMATGKLAQMPGVRVVAGSEVTVAAPDGVPLQADGDAIGHAPMALSVSKRCLELVVP